MDQTKIWDHFQNEAAIGDAFAGARTRYEFLSRQTVPQTQVLNIGVGRGGLEAILLKKGVVVSCLDPSEKSIANLRKQLNLGDRAQVGFSQAMPFPAGQFDAVIMSEVLEHLNDEVLRATLDEVSRVLQTGGRFIGTVPADENLLANQVVCPHCGETFHRWGHVQAFSQSRLAQMLGTRFQDVKVSRHVFGDAKALNWKGCIALLAKRALVALRIKGDGETYFFSAVKQ